MLNNKTILITGASSGIGRATAICASKSNSKLVLMGRNSARLSETLSQCQNDSVLKILEGDLTDKIFLKGVFEYLQKVNIRVDGVVHSAGIDATKPFRSINYEEVFNIFNTNVFASLMLSNGLIKNKLLNKNASVVFLGSVLSFLGQKARVLYSSSKSAFTGACKSLALEYANIPIRFNVVLPGVVQTEMIEKFFESIPENSKDNIINKHPLGIGKPEDVANLIIFLLSDASTWITGSEFIIDGGYSAQ
jgi:NAD(P)-dependent dehydrogenase (short-subunit alcohol dehydrogenase family)